MRKSFFNYNIFALIFTLVFSLFSCNSFVNNIEENSSDDVSVKFSVKGYETSARTIIPTSADTQTLYFTLNGKELATGKEAQLINCKKYEEFASITLKLNAGAWDFTIIGYLDDEGKNAVITGSQKNVTIKAGENNIVFDMKPDETQKGSIKVTLKYDLGTDTQSEISEVKVKRTSTTDLSTALFETTWQKGTPSDYVVVSDLTEGKGYIRFIETNVASGSYFITFEATTKNGTAIGIGYRRDLVIVTGSCESAAELELKVSQAYEIEYDLNGGNWINQYSPDLYYTPYKSVDLPTSDKLTKDDSSFVGWYTVAGIPVSKTSLNQTGKVKYIAKWQNKALFVSASGYDEEGTGENQGDGSLEHPYKTVLKALTKVTNQELDWAINIIGEITENVSIPNTITKTSSAKSITLIGHTGSSVDAIKCSSGSTVSVNSDVPVIISKLKIIGNAGTDVGSSIYGGGGLYVNKSDAKVTLGEDSIVTSGTAIKGGGVYVQLGTVVLNGGTITENGLSTTTSGGGVYIASSGTFTIESGTISKNGSSTTTTSGGGIYVASGGNCNINGGNIGGNEKANHAQNGGGIFNDGGSVSMSGSAEISYNLAGETGNGNGGGVYNANGTFELKGGAITDNQAGSATETYKDSRGGGIYNSGTISISGGIIGKDGTGIPESGQEEKPNIYSNYSNNYGAGIFNDSGATMTFSGTSYKVMGNYAKGQGGGIYNNNNNSPWSNDYVISNAANNNPNYFVKP